MTPENFESDDSVFMFIPGDSQVDYSHNNQPFLFQPTTVK